LPLYKAIDTIFVRALANKAEFRPQSVGIDPRGSHVIWLHKVLLRVAVSSFARVVVSIGLPVGTYASSPNSIGPTSGWIFACAGGRTISRHGSASVRPLFEFP